jgi:pyruvate-ferredoxin/flavodoxin oxidoreductase
MRLRDYHAKELRFRMLMDSDPATAEHLLELGQEQVNRRWAEYEEMATRGAERFAAVAKG